MGKYSATIAAAILGMSTLGASAQKSRLSSGVEGSNSAMLVANHESRERLLTSGEGRALVEMALSQTVPADDRPDCSHFVHQIFAAAGLDYPYAPSFDLYAGTPEFQRVRSPQPGDLIVWRGHVGLVVDPSQHSFYSSLGSGLQTRQYDDDYWRQRGQPRFYRYLVGASNEIAALRKPPQPPVTRISDENDVEEESTPHAAVPRQSAHAPTPDAVEELPAVFQLPQDILVASSTPKSHANPTSGDVAQAISELTSESGGVLRSGDLAALSLPVVVFDQLQVEKLELKRDKGWANVRVDYRVELKQGQVKNQNHSEKRRWELRRTGDVWIALTPLDRIYVPAGVATQLISERLYTLSKKNSTSTRIQQASLARLLDAVFNGNRN